MKLKGKEEEGGGAGGLVVRVSGDNAALLVFGFGRTAFFMRETQKPTPLATLSKHELMVTDAADYYCHDDESYCAMIPSHRKLTKSDIMQNENFGKVGIRPPLMYAS